MQTASLRHFGGGNEVQQVTFGPGYAPAVDGPAAVPGDQRRPERGLPGGAEEEGNTVTIATGNPHTLQPGDS